MRLSAGPAEPVPPAARGLWITSAVLLVLGALVALWVGQETRPDPDRISDHAFARTADERCAETARTVVNANLGQRSGEAEAVRIEALAAGWRAMIIDIRAMAVDRADQPTVDRWLRAWDGWTAAGAEYAAAIRSGDADESTAVLRRSQVPNAEMTHFARVNEMPNCEFH